MNRLLHLGLDPSEIDVPEVEFPTEFSPMPASKWGLHGDPFFVNWISEGLKVSPGKRTNVNPNSTNNTYLAL
jgi:hypothetical protein